MSSFSEFRNKINLKESSILYAQSIDKKKPTNVQNKDNADYSENNGSSTHKNEALNASKECVEHKISKNFKLNDGSYVSLTPELAEKILYVNEELNLNNQIIFESLLAHSIQTYEIALQFCDKY
jgi:hypothetical protein